MDVGRILCDIQHSESQARRNFALYSLKKELKDQLDTTKIDKFLFGNDLADTLKTAKAVSKSSSEMKPESTKPKASTSSNKTYNHRPLNGKARIPARRQVRGPPPQQLPPATRNAQPHRNWSQASSQRPKRNRPQ